MQEEFNKTRKKKILANLLKKIRQHKIVSLFLITALIISAYFGYQNLTKDENAVRYMTAIVEKGMLIVSISGSGQVSVSNQVDIKPKVSGDVVYIGVENDQEVKTGTFLAQIDNRDAQKAVENADISLETAKLELETLLSPPDELTLLKAENVVLQAKNSLKKLKLDQETEYQEALETKREAEDNIIEGYEDAFNAITDAFFDLPTIITGLSNVLYSSEIADSELSLPDKRNISIFRDSVSTANDDDRIKLEKFISSAENNYKTARAKYDENFENYRDASRYSEHDIIEVLLEETIETVRAMAEAVKSEINVLDFWVDYRSNRDLRIFSKVTEYQSNLKSYNSKTNSYLSILLSTQRSFQDNREAKLDAERSLAEMEKIRPLDLAAAEISLEEKEKSLADLKAGPDELEIRAKKITVQQKEDALLAAQQNLVDYYIRAPFDGIIIKVNAKKGDSVSSGTILATLITKQKIAEITLNEIDAARVKVEQKATLQFDAAEDLLITGKVVEIDTLGTVTQGVVSYGVKIAFDVDDERIKPGMTVSTSIVLDSKQNILLVPLSAVKGMGDSSYVEVLVNGQPERKTVVTGSSNDIMTEIIDGLQESDSVITQTINNNATQSSTGQNFQGGPPGGDAMRGMMRMTR